MPTRLPFLLIFLLIAGTNTVFAQISGTVLDETGQPMPYASVYKEASTTGVTTNSVGKFKLPLPPGKHRIVFHVIGYKKHIETINIPSGGTEITVTLQPTSYEIAEVVITDKDPAIRIMREAIERRDQNKDRLRDYSCDVYIKGFHQLADAPEKLLGQEIGDLGGILDSNRQGVIYLSESVSRLHVQKEPPRSKEIMVSSKTSGDENGFSLNRATLTEFNLYNERIEIEREILSPLADNAFSYYDFKLNGKYKDDKGNEIYKIQLIPKRPADPVFSGFIHIINGTYGLAGTEISLTGAAIKQPVLDTLWINQEFIPAEGQNSWCLLSQLTRFKFGFMGFEVDGLFNCVFSDYNFRPGFEKNFFERESFKIEESATKRDSSYWEAIRPVPLTPTEVKDYVVKDSLSKIWESKAFLDSIDRKGNKFKPFDLLGGYTWQNSYKKVRFSWPTALRWVQFNTVQGAVLNIEPSFRKSDNEDRRTYWRAEGALNYGFAEEKFRASASVTRRFEAIHYTQASLEGGVTTMQFDHREPIAPLVNTLYSLMARRNYMKLYEKQFAGFKFARTFNNGWRFRLSGEWARRNPLINNTDYSWYKQSDRVYTLNGPVYADQPFEPYFQSDQGVFLETSITFRLKSTYSSYPGFRIYNHSNLPIFHLSLKQAIPLEDGGPNYLFASAQCLINQWTWGLVGYSELRFRTGAFIYRDQSQFIDAYHPMGNETFLANRRGYNNRFLMLPYYRYSTFDPFVEGHWQHHLQGFLLDKVPGLRDLNWKEVVGLRAFYSSNNAVVHPEEPNGSLYWEASFGFEHIGIKVFRPLRVDVVSGFSGKTHRTTGVVLGIGL